MNKLMTVCQAAEQLAVLSTRRKTTSLGSIERHLELAYDGWRRSGPQENFWNLQRTSVRAAHTWRDYLW